MVSQSLKVRLSSDWSLQLDFMKVELPVIVYQHGTVNLYLSLVHIARHTLGEDFFWKTRIYWTVQLRSLREANTKKHCSILGWGRSRWLEWSRNKVAVGEPAAGSIPFWRNHIKRWLLNTQYKRVFWKLCELRTSFESLVSPSFLYKARGLRVFEKLYEERRNSCHKGKFVSLWKKLCMHTSFFRNPQPSPCVFDLWPFWKFDVLIFLGDQSTRV